MKRRRFAATLASLPFSGQAVAPAAWAQGEDWPARPVRIVCPFTAGGSQDSIARRLGTKLGESLGQSFVIDNRSGAGGSIAADNVANEISTALGDTALGLAVWAAVHGLAMLVLEDVIDLGQRRSGLDVLPSRAQICGQFIVAVVGGPVLGKCLDFCVGYAWVGSQV